MILITGVVRAAPSPTEIVVGRPLDGVRPGRWGRTAGIARAGLDASWGGAFDAAAFPDSADPTPAGTSVTG